MRLLVCGDRDWKDGEMIYTKIRIVMPDVVIEGEARGADTLARMAAERLNIPFEPYPAYWQFYGRSAGPIRNSTMLTQGKPDLVYAFHDDIEHSIGTADMVAKAKRAGIPCEIFKHELKQE